MQVCWHGTSLMIVNSTFCDFPKQFDMIQAINVKRLNE